MTRRDRKRRVVRVLAPVPNDKGDLHIALASRGMKYGPEHRDREGRRLADALVAHLPWHTIGWLATHLSARLGGVSLAERSGAARYARHPKNRKVQ